MAKQYFVSCICPTYSRPAFLLRAVKQFLQQHWQRTELIVLDDSPKELRAVLPQSSRVKVKYIDEHLPLGTKHNMGLDIAQGDLLAHWDDDDWQSPRRLTTQVEALALGKTDICGFATDVLLTTGDAKFWQFDRAFYGNNPKHGFVGNSPINYGVPFMDGSAMFRRSVVGTVRYPSLQVSQKVQFLYDLHKLNGARLLRLPNDGMYIYVRHGSRSHAKNTWQYLKDRRLTQIAQPTWFPQSDLDFYRKAL